MGHPLTPGHPSLDEQSLAVHWWHIPCSVTVSGDNVLPPAQRTAGAGLGWDVNASLPQELFQRRDEIRPTANTLALPLKEVSAL